MLWWWTHLGGLSAVVSGVPTPWLHGLLMQYQVLPTFMFGFLLTAFPRWLAQREGTRWRYLPVGLALLSGLHHGFRRAGGLAARGAGT